MQQQFGGGAVVFPLQVTQGNCAAYALEWLERSLARGGPLLTPVPVRLGWLMARARAIGAVATPLALRGAGLRVGGAPVVLDRPRWPDAFWRLAQRGSGYHSVTIRIKISPPDIEFRHAMACCIEPDGTIYLLEAERGLLRFPGAGSFVPSASAWYAARMRAACERFEVYGVELDAARKGAAVATAAP